MSNDDTVPGTTYPVDPRTGPDGELELWRAILARARALSSLSE